MDIVIAILVSTVISLGIALYFRGLNKNQDPLERINKYANKRQEDLLKLYKEIQSKFNTIIADFNDEFNMKIQTFGQSIESVKNIKAQIDNYAKVLDELNTMTAQVEENLERLHKESGIIDTINGKLSKQQQQVGLLEKKIPEISKDFSAQNAEQLINIVNLFGHVLNVVCKYSELLQRCSCKG